MQEADMAYFKTGLPRHLSMQQVFLQDSSAFPATPHSTTAARSSITASKCAMTLAKQHIITSRSETGGFISDSALGSSQGKEFITIFL
jgi:hypothetical protein